MNTPLPPDHDDTLPGDDELVALYRRLPRSEPGAALDAAVLRAAARAAASDTRKDDATSTSGASMPSASPHMKRKRPRWLVPLGSAASLLLVAGLGWRMRDLPPDMGSGHSSHSAAAAAPVATDPAFVATTADAAAVTVESERARDEVARVQKQHAAQMAMHKAARQVELESAQQRAVTESSAKAMARRSAAMVSERRVPAGGAMPSGGARADKVPVPPPLPVSPAPMPAAAPEKRRGTTAPAETAVAAAPVASVASVAEALQASVEDAANVAAVDNHPVAAEARKPASHEKATRYIAAEADAPVPAAPAPPTVSFSRVDVDTRFDASATPAEELAKIKALHALQHDDDARQRLRDFVQRHPDVPLPPELRALLSSP